VVNKIAGEFVKLQRGQLPDVQSLHHWPLATRIVLLLLCLRWADRIPQNSRPSHTGGSSVPGGAGCSVPLYMHYSGGVTGPLEVLTNETNAFSAHLDLVQACLNEVLARIQLYEALGGDWQQQSLQPSIAKAPFANEIETMTWLYGMDTAENCSGKSPKAVRGVDL
jgi:hypothetical protein